jgi:hypothetical protein
LAKSASALPKTGSGRRCSIPCRRHIEAAYTTMWRLHRDGKPPQSFSVEPWHGIESARKGIAA